MAKHLATICCVTFVFLLSACSQAPLAQQETSTKETATRFKQGSGFFNDSHHRVFRGVASVPDTENLTQPGKQADEQAHAEVQRLLRRYLTMASKQYLASASRAGETVNALSISHDIEQLTRNNAPGIRIMVRWTDQDSAMIGSVAELDLQRLLTNINQAQDITPGFRAYLNQQNQILFDQLSGETK